VPAAAAAQKPVAMERLGSDASFSGRTTRLPLEVSIPRTEVTGGVLGTQTIHYVIDVVGFGVRNQVWKTYEDFDQLHSQISAKTCFALPELPPTYWFGNQSAETKEFRRAKLERLLHKMLLIDEVVEDEGQLIWRFLQLPKPVVFAVRFLLAAPPNRWMWLNAVWETSAEAGGDAPLRHPAVSAALVGLLRAALDGEGHLRVKSSDVALVCELLARLFASGGSEHGPATDKWPAIESHDWIEALLALARCKHDPTLAVTAGQDSEEAAPAAEGGNACLPLAEAAGKALIVLARYQQSSWATSLHDFLEVYDGAVALAETVESDTADKGVDERRSRTLSGVSGCGGGAADAPPVAVAAVQGAEAATGKETPGGGEDGGRSPTRPLQRLVAELLLRGLDGSAVERFAAPDIAAQRKRLLNGLFQSPDAFVRIAVGLLIARLLLEDSFPDVVQAEAGLESLSQEVTALTDQAPRADLAPLLLEDGLWASLCSLATSANPAVARFALLVLGGVARPSPEVVIANEGFHDALVGLLARDAEPSVQGLAAQALLSAYRGVDGVPTRAPLLDELTVALADDSWAVVVRDVNEHGELGEHVAQATSWCQELGSVSDSLDSARSDCERLCAEVGSWASVFAQAKAVAKRAQKEHEDLRCALGEQRTQVRECTERNVEWNDVNVKCGVDSHTIGWELRTFEECEELRAFENCEADLCARLRHEEARLAAGERDYALLERRVKETAEERMEFTKELAEHEEAAFQWAAAEAAGEEDARDCRAGSAWSAQAIAGLRAQAAVLDERLQEACEPLPGWKAELERERSAVKELVARHAAARTAAVCAWGHVVDTQRSCSRGMQSLRDTLHGVGDSVAAEAARRRELRVTVGQLAASLTALHRRLTCLEEPWGESGCEGARTQEENYA